MTARLQAIVWMIHQGRSNEEIVRDLSMTEEQLQSIIKCNKYKSFKLYSDVTNLMD